MNRIKGVIVVGLVVAAFASFASAHEGEEENPAVGPTKGITEANEKDGFKISPEALKKYAIKSMPASVGKTLSVPKSAIFFGLQENNLFRIRNGFYKRIDFSAVSKANSQWVVSTSDLQSGDEIVINGVPFLRLIELQAGGGISDEH